MAPSCIIHQSAAAADHLLRPAKLSTARRGSLYDPPGKQRGLPGGFSSRGQWGRRLSVPALPVLPGNLLFTQVMDQKHPQRPDGHLSLKNMGCCSPALTFSCLRKN